jgi:hypothetical protein
MTDYEIAAAILHGSRHLSGRERRICEEMTEGKGIDGTGTSYQLNRDGSTTPLPADDLTIFRQLQMLHIADIPRWHDELRS